MSDNSATARYSIAEDLILNRLAQSEQMREFFLQMWLQNPILAKRAGERIQALLVALEANSRGDFPTSE